MNKKLYGWALFGVGVSMVIACGVMLGMWMWIRPAPATKPAILDKIDIVQVHPELCLIVAIKNDDMAIDTVDCRFMKEEK